MVKIIMHGCNGHMGQVITGLVKEDANAEIIAGIDMNDNGQNDYPVFKSLADCDVEADVIIDFSNAKAVDDLLVYSVDKKIPVVLCTTGLSEEQMEQVQEDLKQAHISYSMGLEWKKEGMLESMLKAAEQRMYAEKNAYYKLRGRDRRCPERSV